ncbi:MAG: N4-gp56 family major capsid protein [Clostridia bacterium]|nr:N4-gp56 family major capsid protein [Clostridia bacterium]
MDFEIRLDYFALNTTGSEELAAEVKTFYDKALIDLAEPECVFASLGQKKNIPEHSGRYVEFRRFEPLSDALAALEEGVTPNGQQLEATAVEARLEQYGGFVEVSDLLDMTAVDNTVVEATKLLAEQAARTLDTVVRDELLTGTGVLYASGSGSAPDSRVGLTADSYLTVKDVVRAATMLRAKNAPTFDGSYIAVVHPYVAAQLLAEPVAGWVDVIKYADPKKIIKGELGTVAGVRFVENARAKVTEAGTIGGVKTLTVAADTAAGDDTLLLSGAADAASLEGADIVVGGEIYKVLECSETGGVLEATVDGELPAISEGATVTAPDSSADGSSVFTTEVLAKGAFGVTGLGAGAIEHIVKQRGSGYDPLDQRATVGWKATQAVKLLVDDYAVRIESCSPMAKSAPSN